MITRIRSAIFAVYLPFITLLVGMTFCFTLAKKEWAWFSARLWIRTVLSGLKLICGTSYQFIGKENIPQEPVIYAANHQSMMETLVLALELPFPRIILKNELLKIPIFGWWCRRLNFIGIERTGGSSAMREMIKRAQAEIEQGYPVLIFPEGSRTDPDSKTKFHPGVAGLYSALKRPCIPIFHNTGLYWVHPGILRHPGKATFELGAEIDAGLKRKSFMMELETTMQARVASLSAHRS